MWRDTSSVHLCFIITFGKPTSTLFLAFSMLYHDIGPQLAFRDCTVTDRSNLETFSSVMLDFHSSNKEQYSNIACHLTALKIASDTVSARYSAVKSSPDTADFLPPGPVFQRTTPTPAPECCLPIYILHLPVPNHLHSPWWKWAIVVHLRSCAREEDLPFQRTTIPVRHEPICIKFVHSHGEDVHKWCAKQIFAPKLIRSEVLPGGYILVIMKLLDDSWIPLADSLNRVELKAVIHETIGLETCKGKQYFSCGVHLSNCISFWISYLSIWPHVFLNNTLVLYRFCSWEWINISYSSYKL